VDQAALGQKLTLDGFLCHFFLRYHIPLLLAQEGRKRPQGPQAEMQAQIPLSLLALLQHSVLLALFFLKHRLAQHQAPLLAAMVDFKDLLVRLLVLSLDMVLLFNRVLVQAPWELPPHLIMYLMGRLPVAEVVV
jgi:hypothetical protein